MNSSIPADLNDGLSSHGNQAFCKRRFGLKVGAFDERHYLGCAPAALGNSGGSSPPPRPPVARTSVPLVKAASWELPTFENADVFVGRLIRQGILVRDPLVEAAIQGHTPDMSIRSLQYRFLQATGLTHKTIRQIERARCAVSLLEQGTSILDTAFALGYFDQAHLTHSLKRFIGRTLAQIAQKHTIK